MKSITKLLAFTTLSLSTAICAANPVPYSPYADITMDAHWSNGDNDMEPGDLVKVSQDSGVKSYHLAFIVDQGQCTPAWAGLADYSVSKAWASRLTKDLRDHQINYYVSLGGAAGNDLSMACNDEQLLAAYEKIIQTYQPMGLDFDIENGTANAAKVIHALQQVQKNHPQLKLSFTLPVMPEGLVSAGQDLVQQAQAANLNYSVNLMTMDFGPGYTGSMGDYAVQAATQVKLFLQRLYPEQSEATLWSRVEVTPMIGVNDVSTEEFTLADVDTLRTFAQQKQIGGLAMWSISRDKPCAAKWASGICSGDNLQSHDYEYSQRFDKV